MESTFFPQLTTCNYTYSLDGQCCPGFNSQISIARVSIARVSIARVSIARGSIAKVSTGLALGI